MYLALVALFDFQLERQNNMSAQGLHSCMQTLLARKVSTSTQKPKCSTKEQVQKLLKAQWALMVSKLNLGSSGLCLSSGCVVFWGKKHFNLTILLSTQNHSMSNGELLKQLDRILNVNWAIVKSYQRKRSCFRVQSTGLKHTSTL